MKANIVLLPGDGIGPEVTRAARAVLRAVAWRFEHEFRFSEELVGGAAIDATGRALPAQSLAACRAADAVVLGAVGGPRWSDPSASVRPEQGLLALRLELGLFANLRPVQPLASQRAASPLRPERLEGVDLLFVRELTGGIYFGKQQREDDWASDTCCYTVDEVERVTRVAARAAVERSGRLTSVDKANVLETSRLWRETVTRVVHEEFPDLELEHVLVDAMSMHLLQKPAAYDVIVTSNLFGDILSDEASALAGSMGLLPSASIGASGPGLYEPIHGSAPDIAGQGVANPCGAILSAALLLRHSLLLPREAQTIELAVSRVLELGFRTPDLAGAGESCSCEQMLAAILGEL